MSVSINPQINPQASYKEPPKEIRQAPLITHAKKQNDSKILKPTVLLSAITSVGLTFAHIARAQKVKLVDAKTFSDIFKSQNWHLDKIEKIKYRTKEAFQIAAASTLGGLLGGVAVDKDNSKAKVKEGIQQLVGNIMTPIGFALVTDWIFDKATHNHQFKSKNTQNMAKLGVSLPSIGIGMLAGNIIAKTINKAIFGQKHDRKIQIDDLAGQADDICLSAILISPDNKFLQKLSQFIPLALVVPGFETGIKKNKE